LTSTRRRRDECVRERRLTTRCFLFFSFYAILQDIEASTRTKKRRVNKSAFTRSLVGASLEVLAKKRNEKPEVRAAARDAALREIKARAQKKKGAKK
jgi:hypothetical protein